MKIYALSLLVSCVLTTFSFLGVDFNQRQYHSVLLSNIFVKSEPSFRFIFNNPAKKNSGMIPFSLLSEKEKNEMYQYCNNRYNTHDMADCYTLVEYYH